MSGISATDFSVSTSPISPEIRLFSQSQGSPTYEYAVGPVLPGKGVIFPRGKGPV